MPTPLLIISDAPTAGTGLARITRDLATRIHQHLPDVFRVATLGYGGPQQRSLGFPQYAIEMHNWVISNLPEVWHDFAGEEQGVVMTIWDASRLLWFARPENCEDPLLRKFLTKPPFKRWGYFPIDATGPHDKLTAVLKHTIEGYDRVLSYSKWAEDILRRTCPTLENLTNLPHGINVSVFYPRNRTAARHGFGERVSVKNLKGKFIAVPDDALMVGIVATNQARKDWGLGIQTIAELAKTRPVFLWVHTDVLERAWSLPALLNDFGLANKTVLTGINEQLLDEQMAWAYSACDVTLGIGLNEGYGFPIFESLACGAPCVHGDCGGAPEHMPRHMLVPAEMYRIEGAYNCWRPCHVATEWATKVKSCLLGERCSLPSHLDWNNLWPRWSGWLTKGIE